MFDKLKKAFSSFIDDISKKSLSEKDLEDHLWNLQIALLESDVALPVAEAIISNLKSSLIGTKVSRFSDIKPLVKDTLAEILKQFLSSADILSIIRSKKPFVIMFIGVNGTGKTTTIAKIGKYLMNNGLKVVFACSDTFRAGAEEQLEVHANRLGVKLIKHRYGADPAAVAYDAISYAKSNRIDVVLIDTAGRMQTDRGLMDEMQKIHRVAKPDLTVFVGDALTGNDALNQAQEFNKFVPIDAIVLTKIDADAKGGAAISISHILRKPIIFLGVGQGYKDLIKFDPEWIIKNIFAMI
ncbi:MAG: signal recognition particle-docking protein FtsY [Candidatus Methanomethyliaceae archaeon]|nr:signal recognition particle-docking protein FtsY [Candidatus Methanomethyliaceae archaeon]MDW7970675.1 signal recognition particle-docking protein FtsY [Nitrososphaerota archaeon]